MPTPYIKKIAKEKDIPVADVETKWEEAKAKTQAEYGKDNFSVTTAIFNNMIHKKK